MSKVECWHPVETLTIVVDEKNKDIAGATLQEFIGAVQAARGTVYLPLT